MAFLTVVINVMVVSTLLSTFLCDAEMQNVKEMLGRLKDVMKNKQQAASVVVTEQQAKSSKNSLEEISNTHSNKFEDDELWSAIAALQKQIGALEDNVYGQQGEIDEVKKDVDGMETEVQQLKSKTDDLDNKHNQHEEHLRKLDTESNQYNAKLTKIEQGTLGFYAYTTELLVVYVHGDIIQFEYVHHNVGNHYDVKSGKFTCPYHGIYQFTVNFEPVFLYATLAALFSVDGVHYDTFAVERYIAESGDVVYATTTKVMVIECNEGQKVWLEAYSMLALQVDMTGKSTFSGFLVHRLDF